MENVLSEKLPGILPGLVHCMGIHKGIGTARESLQDKDIREFAEGMLEEAASAYQAAGLLTEQGLEAWTDQFRQSLLQEMKSDDAAEPCSDPIVEIIRDSALADTIVLCKKKGIMPYWLTKAAAYLFLYPVGLSPEMQDIQNRIKSYGVKAVIKEQFRWRLEPEMLQLIADRYSDALPDPGGRIRDDLERIKLYKHGWKAGFTYEGTVKGCAQCTLLAVRDVLGIYDEKVFLVASNFAAGMGLCGDGACGGYAGSVMTIGFYAARSLKDIETKDGTGKYKGFEITQKYHDLFKECYGGVVCKEVHQSIFNRSFLIRDRENEYAPFEEAGAHTDKCTTVIAMSVYMLIRLLKNLGY